MGEKVSGIDWPGLLRWSLKYSDGTHETTPLSLERLKFLEEAIRQAMALYDDPNQIVADSVRKLTEDGGTSDGDKISALHLIERCVDDYPEISRQLDKLGALKVLLDLSKDPNASVAQLALQILSFALPNNQKLQLETWNLGGLETLMQGTQSSTDLTENANRFGALSGLIRHVRCIEQDFIARGGCNAIAAALVSANRKVQVKSASLLRHLCNENVLKPEDIIASGVALGLAHMLECVDKPSDDADAIQYGETCATALLELLKIAVSQLATAEIQPTASAGQPSTEATEPPSTQLERLVSVIRRRLGIVDTRGPDHGEEKALLTAAIQYALSSTRQR